MQSKFERELINEICGLLAEQRMVQHFSLSKKNIQKLLNSSGLLARLAGLAYEGKRFTCAEILELAGDAMTRISPCPEEGWLTYCYRFAADTLYPNAGFTIRRGQYRDGALFFLSLLQTIFRLEREHNRFDWHYDIDFLGEEEIADCEAADEYRNLRQRFRLDYIYEMMRLAQEVMSYQTLSHISDVHYIAMLAARGLKAAGLPVDLALISAAALTHDIGKFGCRNGERVPYLHYYYTNQWCMRHGLPKTGHISANHSAWDLELENLQAESLLLIYADFRAKQIHDADGKEISQIFTLRDSFDIILNKLDAVDDGKRRRYRFVYNKLHDFEDFMHDLGICTEPDGEPIAPHRKKDIALMAPQELIESYKFLGIGHNIELMHRLGTERMFGNTLEAARSEKKWNNIRAYLNIFDEYFTYLNSSQKLYLLHFLYELLMHREGDIRRTAAVLAGNIIAHFDQGYHKELPHDVRDDSGELHAIDVWKQYIELVINPDHKLTPQHKSWIGYTLKLIASSTLAHSTPDEQAGYMRAFLQYFSDEACDQEEDSTVFVLLDTIHGLPMTLFQPDELALLCRFAIRAAARDSFEIRAAALRVLHHLAVTAAAAGLPFRTAICEFISRFDDQGHTAFVFLKGRLLRALGQDCCREQAILDSHDIVSDIFLENLKMATPWINKAININILLDQIESGDLSHLLHIAAHFSNLIKVSERIVVRHDAGAALVRIAPLLSLDQRNEIAVELAKGLEVGEYEFSKYIPEYLGQFVLWLHPHELDEMLQRLADLIGNPNDSVVAVSLSTVAVLLERYEDYAGRFPEAEGKYEARRDRLMGMLLKGLASYRDEVRQEALLVIGKHIFASKYLSREGKNRIFSLSFKKLLFLICENQEGRLTFFYRAAALNHIYRFIAQLQLEHERLEFEKRDRIAFFPGTFDPFSLSHKGIVSAIRDLGFEVMLALDEFSWSKKTQPRLIRRMIANMSVADEFHVHIFPDDMPVNLSNPEDLRRLRELFPDRRVYIVVGSDVVANASSYRQPPAPDSIHHYDHIIFLRGGGEDDAQGALDLSCIDGEIIELSLPIYLEDISSSRIRENIDNNRDISNLIDVTAQDYIYQNSLYLREPQYKPILRAKAIRFQRLHKPTVVQIEQLITPMLAGVPGAAAAISVHSGDKHRLIVMRNGEQSDRPVGFIAVRYLPVSELYGELNNIRLAEHVRERAAGRIAVIRGIYVSESCGINDPEQLLLAEALAEALESDCTYALFYPLHQHFCSPETVAALQRQGFVRNECSPATQPLYLADMRSPLVLIQNLETTLKEPFASAPAVLEQIVLAHQRLQRALTGLYPGEVVLSLSSGVIHHRLIDKITALNGVPGIPTQPRRLGPYMCVPFGKILRGKVVPNTVTKTLHTDKVFEPDLSRHTVAAFPFYSSLQNQIRTIKSFMRPVILVDDLLHNSARLNALYPILKQEGIDVCTVIVGMLSGYGRDLMADHGWPVDSVYFVPNLRHWFVESTLYPFIGGDTVRREQSRAFGLTPAINLILPYAAPLFLKDTTPEAIFELSLACIENSYHILLALESEYRRLFERNLTLNRLSEAVILPLCPDKGGSVRYDGNLSATVYLENDIEMLLRTRPMYR